LAQLAPDIGVMAVAPSSSAAQRVAYCLTMPFLVPQWMSWAHMRAWPTFRWSLRGGCSAQAKPIQITLMAVAILSIMSDLLALRANLRRNTAGNVAKAARVRYRLRRQWLRMG
jgi:hypothetical protein